MLGDPGEVFFAGGGVYNEAEEIFGEVVDDKVINHAARGIQHAGIERFTRRLQFGDVVCQQITQKLPGAATVQIDNRHVGHVEHTGIGAHRVVLINLRAVVQRHHPAVEVHHAGAA